MRGVVGLIVGVGLLLLSPMAAEAKLQLHSYSVHELFQLPPMAEGTEVRVHAVIWAGEHGLILNDERCGDECNDVIGLEILSDEAKASFTTALKRLGGTLGCCDKYRAHIDMIVNPVFLNHPSKSGYRLRLSLLRLVKVIHLTRNKPTHRRRHS